MSNLFGINQSSEDWIRSGYISSYFGPPSPQVEALTHRAYAQQRSRIVDQWLVYVSAEKLVAAAQAGEVAL